MVKVIPGEVRYSDAAVRGEDFPRVVTLKFRSGPADDPIAEFTRFRDHYGIGGQQPTYSVASTRAT